MRLDDTIEICDLSRLQYNNLRREITSRDLAIEEDVRAPGAHGELSTITAIMIMAAPLIVAVAAWLLKEAKSDTVSFKGYRVSADGSRQGFSFKHRIEDQKAPSAELIKSLRDCFDVPVPTAPGQDDR